MKKLIPAYAIGLVFSFMLFLYEPITMYANNMNDFWFDFFIIINPLIKMTLLTFACISVLFTVIYFINRIFSKKTFVYNIFLLIFFVVFICFYVQGNFLASNLPPLDGTDIKWFSNEYLVNNISSIVLWVVVIGGVIFASIKLSTDKVVMYTTFGAVLVLVMLGSSFVTTLTTTKDLYRQDVSTVVTTSGLNNISTDKNFFILLLDAVDSTMFDDILTNDDEYSNILKDFSYFKDTMSVFPFTRDSVPQILTGVVNRNEDDFRTYYGKAMNKSVLIDELIERNYNINLYEEELIWNDQKALKTNNVISLDRTIDDAKYIIQQTKYDLFKYLPFFAKKYSKIDTLDFQSTKIIVNANGFSWSNTSNYEEFINSKLNKIDQKYFNYLHIEGAHVPFKTDRNLKPKSNATYFDKLEGCLTIINAFLERIKESGQYDNSVIIIMADHGWTLGNKTDDRQNPILYVKGIDEHHDEMLRSDKAISYMDLNNAYIDLLNGEKSDKIFGNITNERERTYLYYYYTQEDHMVEYKTTGKAWDHKAMYETGKEYNR